MIYPVLAWYPLLVPQELFIDRQGETNAFYETNPAAIFDDDGTLHVAIRLVNYRKFHTRAFKMGGRCSESKYVLWHGTLTDTFFNPISAPQLIKWNNPFPVHGSVWTGYEDLRFLTPSQIIATAPELSSRGEPRLVAAVLETTDGTATLTHLLEPSAHPEKNWMPFSPTHVVYSVYPLVVKYLETDIRATLVSEARFVTLTGYHGSSNGIPWETGHLFLIHKYTERTEHRWLFVDFSARSVAFSEPFTFLPHSYIEFTCSLSRISDTKADGELLIGLGVNDDKAFLIRVRGPDISEFTKLAFD